MSLLTSRRRQSRTSLGAPAENAGSRARVSGTAPARNPAARESDRGAPAYLIRRRMSQPCGQSFSSYSARPTSPTLRANATSPTRV